MRIDEFEFRNEKGQEIEPTKAQLVIYIKSLHKDIKDLEAKLAESEHRNEQLVDALNGEVFINYKLPMENAQLKQQLVEKDRQIEQLKKFDNLNKTFFDLFRTAFKEPNKVDDLFNTLKTMQEKHSQDKISFAVEKLKELQLLFICNYHDNISWIDDKENSCCLNLTATIYNTTIDIFNNQIKQLKGEK